MRTNASVTNAAETTKAKQRRTAASLASISLYMHSSSSGFHRTDFFSFLGSPPAVEAAPPSSFLPLAFPTSLASVACAPDDAVPAEDVLAALRLASARARGSSGFGAAFLNDGSALATGVGAGAGFFTVDAADAVLVVVLTFFAGSARKNDVNSVRSAEKFVRLQSLSEGARHSLSFVSDLRFGAAEDDPFAPFDDELADSCSLVHLWTRWLAAALTAAASSEARQRRQ